MTFKQFVAALRKRGVSIPEKRLRSYVNEGVLKSARSFQDALMTSMYWHATQEGSDFWSNVYNGYQILAPRGLIPNYWIFKDKTGEDWHVGCQKIPRKNREKLFRLLAEDLGYDVEG